MPILFLLAGVLLFSFFPKTPNWFWMGQYSAPDFSLLGTGLPIFRPLIPLETIEWKIHQSNWLSDNFLYGVLSGISLYLLFINCRSKWFTFFTTTGPLMIAIWYASHGGPIYDITAIFGIIGALTIIQTLDHQTSVKRLILLGIFLSIIDLSRPFGLTLCIFMLGYLLIKNRKAVLIPLITLFFLAGPFHINQLARFDTVTLSIYGGNNLMEAFNKVITPKQECYPFEQKKQLDTLLAAKCASANQQKVFNELVGDPRLIFTAINPGRILKTIFPQPVWHASYLDINSGIHIGVRYVFNALLAALYALAFWAIIKPQRRSYKILLLLCFSYVVFTILIASWLSEVIRTYLPALALITLLAQTQFNSPPDEDQIKA
jgi:hypothetical protein